MNKKPKKKSRTGVDEYGRTDLHYAALENNIDKVRLLINSDADTNAIDDDGFSALHYAVQENHKEVVKMLLENGAIVDAKDSYGNTPLMRALDSCYAAMATNKAEPGAIIEILLLAGADPNSVNNYGVKVIDSALDCDRDLKQYFNF